MRPTHRSTAGRTLTLTDASVVRTPREWKVLPRATLCRLRQRGSETVSEYACRVAVGRRFVTWALAHAESAGAASLRRVPLLGGVVHSASQKLSPPGRRDWVTVRSGPGAGLDVLLDTRFEAIVWKGEYEREMLDLLPGLLHPGDVVYD